MRSACSQIGTFFLFAALFASPLGPAQESLGQAAWDTERIDELWLSHLRFRIGNVQGRNLIVETYCRKALQIEPLDRDVATQLAGYYLDKGEATMAAMSMLYLKMVDQDHPLVLEQWAPIMEAIRLFPLGPTRLDGIATGSDLAEGLRRAAIARGERDYVRAENYYRLILTHYPSNRLLLDALGSTYVLSETWVMAAMLYRYALHLYPDDADFANNYALSLGKIGHGAAAIEVLRFQLEQHADDGVIAKNLGNMLRSQGDVQGASEAFAIWTSVEPSNPEAWECYGECLLKRGKRVFAKVALRKAVDLDQTGIRAPRLLLELALTEKRDVDIQRWSELLRRRLSLDEWARLLERPPFSVLAESNSREARP